MSLEALKELSALDGEVKRLLQRGEGLSPVRGCFSRPSRALPFSTMGNRVGPVVAPRANISRASGTHSQTLNPVPASV